MKRVVICGSVLIAGLALGGCATTGGGTPRTAADAVKASGENDIDYGKVVAVNRWAQMRGYGVEWVNMPRKSRAQKTKDD